MGPPFWKPHGHAIEENNRKGTEAIVRAIKREKRGEVFND